MEEPRHHASRELVPGSQSKWTVSSNPFDQSETLKAATAESVEMVGVK
jgi:hypothetical protein